MKKRTRDKLISLDRKISAEKGDFSLFGLFRRSDARHKWDLLVSAPWLEVDKKKGLKYLVKQIKSQLKPDELLSISRIVILERGHPVLVAINKAVKVKHGDTHLENTVFSGIQISQACISTSSANPPIAKQL